MTLKQKTYSAGRWTATSAIFVSAIQILQVAVLARILTPSDFGLMAVTVSVIAVLSLFSDLGLSRAIVHFEDIPAGALHSLYWLNLSAGAILTFAFAISIPLWSWIFRLDGLEHVLLAVSPFFLLSALGQQYCALAEKEFRFSGLAKKEIIATACGFIAALVVAWSGGKVYALVASLLVSMAVGSFIAWWQLSSGYRPATHLNLAEAKPYLRYGRYLIGESVLNTLLRQSDIFIAGLFSTPAKLGMFSLPRDLSLRVGMIVNPVITRVGFPVMSRLQANLPALKTTYLQTLGMTSSINFPLYVALGLFADEIIAILYGSQWQDAVVYLQILSAWGLFRSTGNPVGSLLHAVGAVRAAFWWNMVSVVVVPATYYLSAKAWGTTGLSLSMVIISICTIPMLWRVLVKPYCGATLNEYLKKILIPLAASITSGVVAWGVTYELPHGIARLVLGCASGGAIYFLISWLINRDWIYTIIEIFKINKSQYPIDESR